MRGHWSRVRVGSRKINRVFLKEPESAVRRLCPSLSLIQSSGTAYRYMSLWASAHADPNHSQDLKLRYYDLMIQLALQEDAYLEACSAYQEVWDTEEVKKDEAREIGVSCGHHHAIGNNFSPLLRDGHGHS